MKMAVICHSKSGNTLKMGEIIASGMSTVEGVEARAFSFETIDEEFVKASSCVVFGTPIYMASMSGEMKTFLDTSIRNFALSGKIAGAFATCTYVHGGAELGIQSILSHLMVMGMLAYSGGGSFGPPVIHLGPVALAGKLDEYTETFSTYGKRMAMKTKEIFG